MPDLKNIIKALEVCRDMDNPPGYRFNSCKANCPYYQNGCAKSLKEDAKNVIEKLEQENASLKIAFESMPNWLNEKRPEVVRCKDCKFAIAEFDDGERFCEPKGEWHDPDYFCADGKLKEAKE